MRFIKAALLTTNFVLLSTSLYWTTTSWLHRTPSYTPRPCTLLQKGIGSSGGRYRTEFTVSLHLHASDAPARGPVVAFRYASGVYNQTRAEALNFSARYNVTANYTCFVHAAKRDRSAIGTPARPYDASMTDPGYSSNAWVASMVTLIAVLVLVLQLLFVRVPVGARVREVVVVTPPARVGLSQDRVNEVCVDCCVEECAICLEEDGGSRGARLPCGHAFHRLCVERWLVRGRVCPLCNCDLGKVVLAERRRVESGGAPESTVAGAEDGGQSNGLRGRKSSRMDSVGLD